MGTNYYAIPRITQENKIAIKAAVDTDDFEKARNLLPQKIHIGKSSAGWVFVFNHHNWEYFDSHEAAIKAFLSNCFIYDEYGEKESLDEFWSLVEGKKGKKTDEHITCSDGLYFSIYTDFS